MGSSQSPEAQGTAGPRPPLGGQAAEKGNAHDSAPSSAPLEVTIVQSSADADHARDRETKSDEHEAKDLDAQVRAADAAEQQILPTWFGVGLSFLGTVLIVSSLKEARSANRIAREHMATDLRAWLLSSGVAWKNSEQATDENGVTHDRALGFVIQYANHGRTPARLRTFWAEIRVVDRDEEPPTFVAGDTPIRPGIIGPDATVSPPTKGIVGSDLEGFMAGNKVVYAYALLTYTTVFDDVPRVSECCFRVRFDGYQQNPAGQVSLAMEVASAGPQNTAT